MLIPGPLSPIYEVELVDDGSFAFIKVDTMAVADLQVAKNTDPSIPFKKLIQLVPNAAQMMIDDTDVDYKNYASEEYDNVKIGTSGDPLFGKKFKIRLTSKKTGEKIDLNVTYTLLES